jgi:omega-hydroxy-beta-dihydromenaquinone-9 sulfotransferase
VIRAFLLSLRLHGRWWLEAFGREGRHAAPLGTRRLVVLLIGFPAFMLLQMLHWLAFLLDEVLFRGYRRVEVKAPLFVTGVPRSGTTFVHRALARDESQFSTFRTWEALFAPAIVERKAIAALAALDRRLGAPLSRWVHGLNSRVTGNLTHIHEVGLQAAEEDYLTLLPAGGCFIAALAFPVSASVWSLGRLPELPEAERRVLLDFYHAMLQKHLYTAPPGRRLLSKNAAFGSWLPELATRYPDGRFLVCLREPTAALSSQLSAIEGGLALFGTTAAREVFVEGFRRNLAHVYKTLPTLRDRLGTDRLAVIDQGQLRRAPAETIERALEPLGLSVGEALRAEIAESGHESTDGGRRHRHAALRSGKAFDALAAEIGSLHRDMTAPAVEPPHAARRG